MPQVPSPTPPAFSLCSQLPLSAGKRKREGSKDARVAVEALSFRPSSPSPRFPVSPRAAARLGTAQIGSAPGDAARPGQHGSAQLGVTKVRFSRTLLR